MKNKKTEEPQINSIAEAIKHITTKHGAGSVVLGESNFTEIEWIHSGSIGLDYALGGGWPRGRIVEIFGQPSSGKTNLALHAIREAQKKNLACAFVDLEHALDPSYAASIGVDVSALLISQPNSGEQALDIIETFVRTGEVALIAVDSVANLVPEAELDGDFGQAHMGLQARLLSQGMRKLTATVAKHSTCLMFLNQVRSSLSPYGSPFATTGGNALKFYASQRVETKVSGKILDKDEIVAITIDAKIIKNKVGFPFRIASFDLKSDRTGIDSTKELVTLGVKYNIIEKAGAWFSYGEIKLGHGEKNSALKLKETPELAEEIRQKILANFRI